MDKIAKGTWVEIESLVLRPEERAPAVPEDTKKTPLMMRASGFLLADAAMGDEVGIRSIIGRELRGKLRAANPSYSHSFGTIVPELLTIGTEAER